MADIFPPAGPSDRAGKFANIEEWRQKISGEVAKLYVDRPVGVDPDLADAFFMVSCGIRECTRLIGMIPSLREDEAEYRRLAMCVAEAASAARRAYMTIDIRVRRAGGPNPMLDALNDVLTVQGRAPVDPSNTPGGFQAILTNLYSSRSKLFDRVQGKGIIDRMMDQLARVPQIASIAAPSIPIQPGPLRVDESSPVVPQIEKSKRSTTKGDAESKLIAAMTQHHAFADDSCLNLEPISCRKIAESAEVAAASASRFFKKWFGGYNQYRSTCLKSSSHLSQKISTMRGEQRRYNPLGHRDLDDFASS